MAKITRMGSQDARNRFPALIEAAQKGRATIITRHGRPVAALVPLDAVARRSRQQALLPLQGTGTGLWGARSAQTIQRMRDEWDR